MWIAVPAAPPSENNNGDKENDPWVWWNRLRLLANGSNRLGVALILGADVPDETMVQRWLGEPIRAVFIDTKAFLTNRAMYPVLPKAHQRVLQQLLRLGAQPIITGHCRSSKGYLSYAQYLAHMYKTSPPKSVIENFAAGYEDTLQCPLQPLMDNLESQTYETFERDPTKYELYHQAVMAALVDMVPVEERETKT